MNRKVLGGILGLVLVAAAVYVFALRHRGEDPKPDKPIRSAAIDDPWAKSAKHDEPAKPQRGLAPRWQLDVDAEGALRLEGQVVDDTGHGVAGAEVTLGSVPPRTAKAEADGTFSFDKLVGRTYTVAARAGE